jgi:branched-chain amino acid transport system substrate-binding protein
MWTWCLHAMRSAVAAIAIGIVSLSSGSAQTGQPIRIGLSLALTGAGAAPSKVISTALEMWRDDVNAKGGLLGRPVELVIYDDQSTPANVPAIYTKLITLDKVDLLLGPYGTNFVAPALPAIMAHNKMTISFTAIGINDKFKYDKYFSMVSVGPDGAKAFSRGFLEIAMAQKPQPETVAILAADAEFARTAADGAREELKKHRLKLIYDQSYPPQTTDFLAVMRAVRAANADVVWIGAYPPDNVGIIRAADEIGLSPKIFGGAMIGMLVTPLKVQLGPLANGLLIGENFAAAQAHSITGGADFLKRYGVKASAAGIDPLGFAWGPFAYSAGQVLAQAVTETKSLDHDKLAAYMHQAKFDAVAGSFSFASDGEWAKSRQVWTQFQNVQPNNLDQFREGKVQPIIWPADVKTGNLIYPYADAKKK